MTSNDMAWHSFKWPQDIDLMPIISASNEYDLSFQDFLFDIIFFIFIAFKYQEPWKIFQIFVEIFSDQLSSKNWFFSWTKYSPLFWMCTNF